MTHFTAQAHCPESSLQTIRHQLGNIEFLKTSKTQDPRSFYETNKTSDFGLYHGPAFQVMKKIYKDNSRIIVEVDHHGITDILNNPALSRLALWIDGAFQSLGLLNSLSKSFQALPVSIGEFMVFPHQPTAQVYLHPTITSQNNDNVTGDVIVSDEAGQVLSWIKAIKMNTLSKHREK